MRMASFVSKTIPREYLKTLGGILELQKFWMLSLTVIICLFVCFCIIYVSSCLQRKVKAIKRIEGKPNGNLMNKSMFHGDRGTGYCANCFEIALSLRMLRKSEEKF